MAAPADPADPGLGHPAGRPRWLMASLVVVALSFAILAMGTIRISADTNDLPGPQVGRPAPDFRLSDLDGQPTSLSELRGRPVVVNFWASYCLPCRDEAPLLDEAQARYAAAGLQILGVVFQDDADSARAFMEEFAVRYPGLLDPGGRAAIDYGVRGIPETFMIGRDGTIRRVFLGPLQVDRFRAAIEEIL
ncbi:MAG: TlpA family protein disulfide reductase [Candidatus Limnocylindrales bacterium]